MEKTYRSHADGLDASTDVIIPTSPLQITTTTDATAHNSDHSTGGAHSYVTDTVVFCFGFVTGMILAAIYTYGLPVAFRSLCAAAASH